LISSTHEGRKSRRLLLLKLQYHIITAMNKYYPDSGMFLLETQYHIITAMNKYQREITSAVAQ
jgi:hypothetical protein